MKAVKIIRGSIMSVAIVGIVTTTILTLCFTTAFAQSLLHSILFGLVGVIMTMAAIVSAIKHKISNGIAKLFYLFMTCVLTFISMCASYGALEFGRQASILNSSENMMLNSQNSLAQKEINSLLDQKRVISENLKNADQSNFLYAQNKATDELKRLDNEISKIKTNIETNRTEQKDLNENIATGYNALFVELRNKLNFMGIKTSTNGVASFIHWVIAALFDISVIILVNASFPKGFFEQVFESDGVRERSVEFSRISVETPINRISKSQLSPVEKDTDILKKFLRYGYENGANGNGNGRKLLGRDQIISGLNLEYTPGIKLYNKLTDYDFINVDGQHGTYCKIPLEEAIEMIEFENSLV